MTKQDTATTVQLDLPEFVSPYRYAQIINEQLGTSIKPQMIYNYVGKGYIKTQVSETGKKMVSREEGVRWATEYVARKNNKNEAAE